VNSPQAFWNVTAQVQAEEKGLNIPEPWLDLSLIPLMRFLDGFYEHPASLARGLILDKRNLEDKVQEMEFTPH